jgi:hypothetical protein
MGGREVGKGGRGGRREGGREKGREGGREGGREQKTHAATGRCRACGA